MRRGGDSAARYIPLERQRKSIYLTFPWKDIQKFIKKTRKSFDRWAQEIKQGKWQVSSMEQKDLFWHQSTLVSYFGGGTSQELFNREVFHPHYGHRQYKSWFFAILLSANEISYFKRRWRRGNCTDFQGLIKENICIGNNVFIHC